MATFVPQGSHTKTKKSWARGCRYTIYIYYMRFRTNNASRWVMEKEEIYIYIYLFVFRFSWPFLSRYIYVCTNTNRLTEYTDSVYIRLFCFLELKSGVKHNAQLGIIIFFVLSFSYIRGNINICWNACMCTKRIFTDLRTDLSTFFFFLLRRIECKRFEDNRGSLSLISSHIHDIATFQIFDKERESYTQMHVRIRFKIRFSVLQKWVELNKKTYIFFPYSIVTLMYTETCKFAFFKSF